MSLHDPVNFARIVRGLINIQQHEGMFILIGLSYRGQEK